MLFCYPSSRSRHLAEGSWKQLFCFPRGEGEVSLNRAKIAVNWCVISRKLSKQVRYCYQEMIASCVRKTWSVMVANYQCMHVFSANQLKNFVINIESCKPSSPSEIATIDCCDFLVLFCILRYSQRCLQIIKKKVTFTQRTAISLLLALQECIQDPTSAERLLDQAPKVLPHTVENSPSKFLVLFPHDELGHLLSEQ